MQRVEKKFWVDKLADEVASKFPGRSIQRTENGVGASGIPHIGSISDAVRSYGVKLALQERGFKAEHVAFSDDKDGLRKVPKGFPEEFAKFIGMPVTSVPDPFSCHASYGDHMSSLLLDALDRLGIQYTFMSGSRVYRSGQFEKEIKLILEHSDLVGRIILEETGQDKYTKTLPYLPVCENCGRIYTTTAVSYDFRTNAVLYECSGGEIAGKWVTGCGYRGARKLSEGEGKLPWKAEFSVRWAALGISFEAYGKELTDSVATNDRICKEVLGKEPPVHTKYELFISKSGRKLSKSSGEVVTHTEWLRYGSPASLLLLMFKRFEGAREVGIEDVPVYMNELDQLEDIYFGRQKTDNDASDKVSLYRYSYLLRTPPEPSLHPPYSLLVYLNKIAVGDAATFVFEKLRAYGYIPATDYQRADLRKRIEYAANWVKDFGTIEVAVKIDEEERKIIATVLPLLEVAYDENGYQQAVYTTARKLGIEPKKAFRSLYKALLGSEVGPKLGPYIRAMGKDTVLVRLKSALGEG